MFDYTIVYCIAWIGVDWGRFLIVHAVWSIVPYVVAVFRCIVYYTILYFAIKYYGMAEEIPPMCFSLPDTTLHYIILVCLGSNLR